MKRNNFLVTLAILLLVIFGAEAQKPKPKKPVKKPAVEKTKTQPVKKPVTQKTKPVTKTTTEKSTVQKSTGEKQSANPDAAQDEKKVRDIVAFLEYMLNTLGSSGTSTRDKDVLITESYSKVFRDSKVQVEDDLDDERFVITNKDIVAYLKDVDFFFSDVRFEFTIDDIQSNIMADGKLFYKVTTSRNLKGTTQEGEAVNNTSPRYIEINYNPKDQDLKIVSIYTNEFNEKDALNNWWGQLSLEWQSFFKKKLNITDSVDINAIKDIVALQEIDLSNNGFIQDIEPLGEFVNLKKLNLAGTSITSLNPIRNLTELVELNLSGTKILDLTPLKYSIHIQKLNINDTKVNDISPVSKMTELQVLEMKGTEAIDFTPLSGLTGLRQLNLGSTKISDLTPIETLAQLTQLTLSKTLITGLNPIKGFKALTELNIDSTRISGLNALENLEGLRVLHANYTMISDLKPLQKLPNLEKIYCDQTPVTRQVADAFMSTKPKVLVVFDSKDLKVWWETLPDQWKEVLGRAAKTGLAPAKDELARVTNLDSINLSGNTNITDLEPLGKLRKLSVLIANKTGINNLMPLKDQREIRYLDISDTEVEDLSIVSQFTKLKELRADGSKIQNIDPLSSITTLKKLYADHTAVHDIIAQEFLEKNPGCLIVYKTVHLKRWWSTLSETWKEVLLAEMGKDTTRENFHKLVEQEKLHFKDAQVSDLTGLSEFVRLKELHISGTAITEIAPPASIKSLKSFHATNSPIQKIDLIVQLSGLEDLDISNTPIDDLKVISNLQQLKKLNCAGTQVKRLDALETLQSLEFLDCSNTFVNKLDPVANLPLKTLKCYNTKIPARRIEDFKAGKPTCNVIYYR